MRHLRFQEVKKKTPPRYNGKINNYMVIIEELAVNHSAGLVGGIQTNQVNSLHACSDPQRKLAGQGIRYSCPCA
jgi:hypothetical protein